jgi:hypothetical protein
VRPVRPRIAESAPVMFGSFLPSLGWLGTTKVYSGVGADIVMESNTLFDEG